MALDPETLALIDHARAEGDLSHPDQLPAFLPKGATPADYLNTPLPDGRLRSQVNPGDTSEWHRG